MEPEALEAVAHYLSGELERAHLIAAQLQGNLVLAQKQLAQAREEIARLSPKPVDE